MSPNRRNIVVGVVVLVALGVLAWMVLQFANRAATFFLTKGTRVQMVADRADGLSDGSAVFYRGVGVGRVTGVKLTNDERVMIDLIIEPGKRVPTNVTGVIRAQSMLSGSASINLELKGPKPSGETVQANTVLEGGVPAGNGLIPESFNQLAEDARDRELVKHFDETVVSLRLQAEKAGQLIESVNSLVSDEKMREDLRATVEKLHSTAEQADKIAANLEKFSGDLNTLSQDASATIGEVNTTVVEGRRHMNNLAKQINGRMEQVGDTLEHFQSIAAKIDQGEGTAGMLVNDPRLYQSLTDTSGQLNGTVTTFGRLVEQWEQEGFSLKLR